MKLLVAAALITLSPPIADACSISRVSARILRPTSGDIAGSRPFIYVSVKDAKVTRVVAGCQGICKGTPVEVDAFGAYLRPKAPLPEGSKLQVTRGTQLLDAAVIGKASKLPAWDGIEWISSTRQAGGKCTPAGPVVHLRVKPTSAVMSDAYLVVYLSNPDASLGTPVIVQPLENYESDLELRNSYGDEPLGAVPKTIFVRLADGNGNLGPVIKLP